MGSVKIDLIFRLLKKEQVSDEWKYGIINPTHKKEYSVLCKQLQNSRFRWAGHVARMEEGRIVFKILRGRPKPTGKRLLGRPRRRWGDNIIKDLEEIGKLV